MSNFFVIGDDPKPIKDFFSVLPEDKRPKVVSDKEYPNAWDHPSDKSTVIVTSEPRTDTEAKELSIEGKQVDEVVKEMEPEPNVVSDDPTLELPEPKEEEEPIRGPLTYADRGFKVGRLV